MKRETGIREEQLNDAHSQQVESEATNLLSSYKSEGDPGSYEKAYLSYQRFVEGSLDVYKVIMIFFFNNSNCFIHDNFVTTIFVSF